MAPVVAPPVTIGIGYPVDGRARNARYSAMRDTSAFPASTTIRVESLRTNASAAANAIDTGSGITRGDATVACTGAGAPDRGAGLHAMNDPLERRRAANRHEVDRITEDPGSECGFCITDERRYARRSDPSVRAANEPSAVIRAHLLRSSRFLQQSLLQLPSGTRDHRVLLQVPLK